MPTKHDRYYQLMLDANQPLFDSFAQASQDFQAANITQEQFDVVGRNVLDVVHFWERKLCSGMERGRHSQYSANLAEKFWQHVRSDYPLIDQVGIKHK